MNLVSPGYKSHPATSTSEAHADYDDDNDDAFPSSNNPKKRKRANKRLEEVEAEGLYLWEVTKHYLLRPGVAGGLVGLSRSSSRLNITRLISALQSTLASWLVPAVRFTLNLISVGIVLLCPLQWPQPSPLFQLKDTQQKNIDKPPAVMLRRCEQKKKEHSYINICMSKFFALGSWVGLLDYVS